MCYGFRFGFKTEEPKSAGSAKGLTNVKPPHRRAIMDSRHPPLLRSQPPRCLCPPCQQLEIPPKPPLSCHTQDPCILQTMTTPGLELVTATSACTPTVPIVSRTFPHSNNQASQCHALDSACTTQPQHRIHYTNNS